MIADYVLAAALVGSGFAKWSGMHHLTSLSLQNASKVSDEGCAAIAHITSLRTLNLKNCPALTDASLALLTPLDRLCHLKLQVCFCHGYLSLTSQRVDGLCCMC